MPRYKIGTDLSSRVGWLNFDWQEQVDEKGVDVSLGQNLCFFGLSWFQERFLKASALAGEEFIGRLDYLALSWLPARALVLNALNSRKNVDTNGKLILFERHMPWKVDCRLRVPYNLVELMIRQEHLFNLEEELDIPSDEKPLYALYEDESKKWRVQAVPVASESFESRKALPDPWVTFFPLVL